MGHVSHQTNLGVSTYDLDELYSPDTELWKSKVLDLGSPKYQPQVAAAPTRYWFDRSRYQRHGTITGATWKQLPSGVWVLSFDGDDYITAGTGIVLSGDFTLEAWTKITTIGAFRSIFGQASAISGADKQLYFRYNVNGNFMFGFQSDDLVYTNVDDSGKWVYWAGTYNAATNARIIYKDGIAVANDTATGDLDVDNQTFYIGAKSDVDNLSQFFLGLIGLPKASNVVNPPAVIQQSYLRDRWGFQ